MQHCAQALDAFADVRLAGSAETDAHFILNAKEHLFQFCKNRYSFVLDFVNIQLIKFSLIQYIKKIFIKKV